MIEGIAAGVPYVARPPDSRRAGAPVVLAWHLLDPPRSERALAAALPLDGLDAWRVYLGLPLSGSRLPPGGVEEVFRIVMDEPVLNVHRPVIGGGVAEAGPAFAAIRSELGIGDGPVGVLGGSAGGAVAGLVALEGDLDVRAVALVNPLVDLRATIDVLAGVHGITYTWTEEAADFAARVDLPRRAAGFADRAVLVVTGQDDVPAFLESTRRLVDALPDVETAELPGTGHALAQEPGLDPAPQLPAARRADGIAVDFFTRHL